MVGSNGWLFPVGRLLEQVVLSSDEEVFGGYKNATKDADVTFLAQQNFAHDNRPHSFQVRSQGEQLRMVPVVPCVTSGLWVSGFWNALAVQAGVRPASSVRHARCCLALCFFISHDCLLFQCILPYTYRTALTCSPPSKTCCSIYLPRDLYVQVYAPSRTVVVYAPAEFCDKDADRKPHGVPGLGVKGLGPYYER